MKNTLLTMTFAAAAMLATAATGSAQSMKAEIPFGFQAAGARMPAGSYSVTLNRTSGTTLVQIHNWDTHSGVLAVPVTSYPDAAGSTAVVLRFVCTEGSCVLSQLRDANSQIYQFRAPKKGPETRIATVVLRPDRGE